jgi:hypothetical protein
MKTQAFRALLVATALAPATAYADDKPPPAAPNAIVYVGSCLSPALNGPRGRADTDQSAFLATVLAAAIPSLIGSGLDWIGAELTALGEDKKTTVFGARATEATVADRTCVQVVRLNSKGTSLEALLQTKAGWKDAADAAKAAAVAGTEPSWSSAAVPTDQPVDFFVEFWIRPSTGREVVSLTPTLLYYPQQLTDHRNGQHDAAIVVAAKLEPSGQTAASWTWGLPRQAPTPSLQVLVPARDDGGRVVRQRMGDLRRICESACAMASPWTGNPWAKDKPKAAAGGGALAANVGPGAAGAAGPTATNVSIEVTEIRAGSQFFKALGAAFTASKPALKTGLEQAIIPAKAAEAETTATTAKATALTAFATKLGEVDATQKDKYCAAKGKPGANWTALSAELQAKQLLANVAAEAAEVPKPFPTPIPVSNAIDPGRCP